MLVFWALVTLVRGWKKEVPGAVKHPGGTVYANLRVQTGKKPTTFPQLVLAILSRRMLLQHEEYRKAHESGDPADLGRVSGKPR